MYWFSGWNKRIKLTIDNTNIDSTLIDFPVLVNLTSSTPSIFTELGSNSKKLSIVASTGEECYVEIERWDDIGQSAQLWVKVPEISPSEPTELYLMYDGTHADNVGYVGNTSDDAAKNVWDDNFVAVYHMSQDPSIGGACILDSTSNNIHGTPQGSMDASNLVVTPYGWGLDFNGSSNYITLPEISSIQGDNDFTIDASLRYTSGGYVLTKRELTFWGDRIIRLYSRYATFIEESDQSTHTTGSATFTENDYYTITTSNDAGNVMDFYAEGVSKGSVAKSGSQSSNDGITIGCRQLDDGTPSNFYGNEILEVRISTVLRTNTWIKATNYSNMDNLVTFDSEELITSGSLISWGNKLTFVIPPIDSFLYDFPVLLNISSDSGKNDVDLTSIFEILNNATDRKRIAITDSTGIGQCFVEIENWSNAERDAQLWFKAPKLSSSTDNIFTLHYDSTKEENTLFVGDTGTLPASKVWDSYFVAIYHMNQIPVDYNSVKDSTSNTNHGTPYGNMNGDNLVDGMIGKAIEFDDVDDTISISNESNFDFMTTTTPTYTIECIINTLDTSSELITKEDQSIAEGVEFRIRSGILEVANLTNFSNYTVQTGTTVVSDGVDHHVVGLSNSGLMGIYIDGYTETLDTLNEIGSYSEGNNDKPVLIGSRWNGSNKEQFYGGTLDEIRISNISRSSSWIKTTNYSNTDELVIYEPEFQTDWLQTYEDGELSPWAKRIKVSIDNIKVDSSQVNFPVLLNITGSSGYNLQDITSFFTELFDSSIDDDFIGNDGDNPNKWELDPEAYIQSDRLRINRLSGTGAGPSSLFNLAGDFDIQVDFDVTGIPSMSGGSSGDFIGNFFGVRDVNEATGEDDWSYISRVNRRDGTENTYVRYGSSHAYSEDIGKMRLTRVGSTLSYYRWDGADWGLLESRLTFTTNNIYVNLRTWGTATTLETGIVYFDNFILNSGTIIWPQGSLHNRKKIAITQSDGVTQLPIEIESYDSLNNSIQLWTKIPFISSEEDTDLYLYYDSTKSDNTDYIGDTGEIPARQVWDDNFISVYHMSQDPSGGTGAILDSTIYIVNGTPVGSMDSNDLVDGAIGKAVDFDGGDDRLDLGTVFGNFLDGFSGVTLETTSNFDSLPATGAHTLLQHTIDGGNYGIYMYLVESDGSTYFRVGGRSIGTDSFQSGQFIYNDTGVYSYLAGTIDYDKGNIKCYVNDNIPSETSAVFSNSSYTLGTPVFNGTIGSNSLQDGNFVDGKIDEIRISNIVRSSSWLKVTNYSSKDTLCFYNIEETYIAPVVTPYYYHGYIKEQAQPASRKVFLYNRTDGSLIDADDSQGSDGYYLLETTDDIEHFIVVLDDDDVGDDYEAQIKDRLLPNGE